MLTVQKVPRIAKPSKTGNVTDSEREEGDKAKVEESQTNVDSGAAVEMSAPKDDSSQLKETPSSLESDYAQGSDIVVKGLSDDMTTVLIRACVSMISVPVDPDTLHATLRLCLRLTRNHHYAMMFAELKSTRMILGLTQSSGFNGFTPLVTLLFRHIIEDPATLRHTMEKAQVFAADGGAAESSHVLAFVLDHLLPHTQNSEDKDTPALARLFLASLAAAGTGTDAQVALVNEVKAALSKPLTYICLITKNKSELVYSTCGFPPKQRWLQQEQDRT
ncbi:hypothetical protein XENOCAPTIV_025616 [Xenoophorus captivus]|uniref:Uncharacterized protein n=1 Tax=Xenoophorus captivus TaxID=1517983 RepID=A0ABV0SBG3_9TELE